MSPDDIKFIVMNSTEPIVFNNLLTWELLDWNMDKWSECLSDTILHFRLGYKAKSKEPQWEKTCEVVKGTFKDFQSFNEDNKWLYFDYKYLNQWFIDKFDLRNAVSWENFGYSDVKVEDSTIWIGSEGAHTPCHVDTYGFNLVAQIKGRKMWLLFPPETDLKPTRIPYEESTIYSSLNFYSPSENMVDFLSNEKCKKVILEPGQVLLVPNGWWHYVENLEMSISINTWIPMKNDNKKRISEAITLMMVKTLTSQLEKEEQGSLINNLQELLEVSTVDILNLVETTMNNYGVNEESLQVESSDKDKLVSLLSIDDNYKTISNLSSEELQEFLKLQTSRFSDVCGEIESKRVSLVKKYLSVLTDSDVVALIAEKLKAKCD